MHGVQEISSRWVPPLGADDHDKPLPIHAADDLARRIAPEERAFRYRLVSKASYARRLAAANGSGEVPRLSRAESERVTRLRRLWDFAVEVWGSETKARRFLAGPHMLLRGQSPLDVALSGESGGRRVEDLLGGLAYGTAV